MLNFILCDDNKEILKINENIITKQMFKNDLDYKIYSFSSYTNEMKTIINEQIGRKVYIIDIDLGDASGINIVRKIRKNDWDSIIIFSTAHSELFPQILKDRLMILDFISKYDDYKPKLRDTIKEIVKIYSSDKFLTFTVKKILHNVRYKDILYISFDKKCRKTLLHTINQEYNVSKPMISLVPKLPNYFIKINNHCIINKINISKVTSDGLITFINGYNLKEKINCKELINSVLV